MKKESVIALSEKLFLLTNGMNKEKLDQYIKEGMPYIYDKGERFFYGNAVDWKYKKENKSSTVADAWKRGFRPDGV